MNSLLTEWLLPLIAGTPRMAAVLLMFSMFGRRVLRGLIRSELVLVLAIFLLPQTAALDMMQMGGWRWLILLAREAAIGLTLGFFLGAVFWIAENLGYLIDLQTGTSNLAVFDPMSEQADGPMSSFILQIVIALVLAGGGLLVMLEVVFESYRVWPIRAAAPALGEALPMVLGAQADRLLWQTLRFAAPMIVLLLLIDLVLGLLGRFAEHVDPQSWAMPFKSMAAFFILLLFASFIHESIRELIVFDSTLLQALSTVFGER